jgi:hypothetical protein
MSEPSEDWTARSEVHPLRQIDIALLPKRLELVGSTSGNVDLNAINDHALIVQLKRKPTSYKIVHRRYFIILTLSVV